MLKIFYHFSESVEDSDSVNLFKENMLDGEFLLFPYKEGMEVSEPGTLLFSDVQEVLTLWEQQGGCSVGYEYNGNHLQAKELVTDIDELYPEDVSDIADYATETTHYAFFSGDFDYMRLGFADYKRLYALQQEEPYLLPKSLQNLSEEELHKRYCYDMENARMNPLYTVYGFSIKETDEIIGQIALEHSELTDMAINISYYIVPKYRNKGMMTAALKAFLSRMLPYIGETPILAIISRENPASVAVAKKNGFSLLPTNSKILEKRPEGFFAMVCNNTVDSY